MLIKSAKVPEGLCKDFNGSCTFLRNSTSSLEVSGLNPGTLYKVDVYALVADQRSDPFILETYTGKLCLNNRCLSFPSSSLF